MEQELLDFHQESLIFEGAFVLHWQEVDALPEGVQLARLNATNEMVLRNVAVLEVHLPESGEERTDVEADIARLDNKINVLLEMVSQLLQQHSEAPPAVPALLSPYAIEWWADHTPAPGSHVEIELFINPTYPRPLILPGTVQLMEDTGEGDHAVVSYEGLNIPVHDLLEKYVFRHHRRAVAQSRRVSPQE